MEWMQEVLEYLQGDSAYAAALEQLKKLEPQYTAFRASLDTDSQLLLDRYISVCEEIDDILCNAAYTLGHKHIGT